MCSSPAKDQLSKCCHQCGRMQGPLGKCEGVQSLILQLEKLKDRVRLIPKPLLLGATPLGKTAPHYSFYGMPCIVQMWSWGQGGCGLSRSCQGSISYLGRSSPGSGLLLQASSVSTAAFLWLAPPPLSSPLKCN